MDVSGYLDYRLLGLNNENMILNKMTAPKMTTPNRIAFIKAGFIMGMEVPIRASTVRLNPHSRRPKIATSGGFQIQIILSLCVLPQPLIPKTIPAERVG